MVKKKKYRFIIEKIRSTLLNILLIIFCLKNFRQKLLSSIYILNKFFIINFLPTL